MTAGGAADGLGGSDSEWSLYWTDRHVEIPQGFLPLLDTWADIDAREIAAGIDRHTAIFLDPTGHLDPRLAQYTRRSRFAFMTTDSQESYAKDDRLFFTFLWQRGKNWDEADPDDIQDYDSWRRRSEDNPERIGGAKWGRELAAFIQLYSWARDNGHIVRSPVLTHTVRLREGGTAEVADESPKDV